MILNNTNSKTIQKIYNTPYIEDWSGKKITVYVKKVKAFGDWIEALRVKETTPALPELLPTDTENWLNIKKAMISGYKIEDIRKKWKISKENETKLNNEINETV